MYISKFFVRSSLVVSLALGLAACGQQAGVPTAAAPVTAQADTTTPELVLNFPKDRIGGVAADIHGNLYVSHGGNLEKRSPAGKVLWSKSLGGTLPGPLKTDRSGFVYVNATNPDIMGGFIAKYAPDGTQLWKRNSRTATGFFISLAVDRVGNVYSLEDPDGNGSLFLTRWSTQGSKVWEKMVLPERCEVLGSEVGVNLDGNVVYLFNSTYPRYYAPECNDSEDSESVFSLTQFKQDGTQVFKKNLGGTYGSMGRLAVSPAGSAYTMRALGSLDAGFTFDLSKRDVTGNQKWTLTFPSSNADPSLVYNSVQGLAVNDAGKLYVGGSKGGQPLLEKRDPDTSKVVWTSSFKCPEQSQQSCVVTSITVGALGKLWAAGYYGAPQPDGSFVYGNFIVRLSQ